MPPYAKPVAPKLWLEKKFKGFTRRYAQWWVSLCANIIIGENPLKNNNTVSIIQTEIMVFWHVLPYNMILCFLSKK